MSNQITLEEVMLLVGGCTNEPAIAKSGQCLIHGDDNTRRRLSKVPSQWKICMAGIPKINYKLSPPRKNGQRAYEDADIIPLFEAGVQTKMAPTTKCSNTSELFFHCGDWDDQLPSRKKMPPTNEDWEFCAYCLEHIYMNWQSARFLCAAHLPSKEVKCGCNCESCRKVGQVSGYCNCEREETRYYRHCDNGHTCICAHP